MCHFFFIHSSLTDIIPKLSPWCFITLEQVPVLKGWFWCLKMSLIQVAGEDWPAQLAGLCSLPITCTSCKRTAEMTGMRRSEDSLQLRQGRDSEDEQGIAADLWLWDPLGSPFAGSWLLVLLALWVWSRTGCSYFIQGLRTQGSRWVCVTLLSRLFIMPFSRGRWTIAIASCPPKLKQPQERTSVPPKAPKTVKGRKLQQLLTRNHLEILLSLQRQSVSCQKTAWLKGNALSLWSSYVE